MGCSLTSTDQAESAVAGSAPWGQRPEFPEPIFSLQSSDRTCFQTASPGGAQATLVGLVVLILSIPGTWWGPYGLALSLPLMLLSLAHS